MSDALPAGGTPTPNPSPQGGGELFFSLPPCGGGPGWGGVQP
jgi:hypothetical protein